MLNYNVKGTGVNVTDELRIYIEKKLSSAEKFINGDTTVHTDVELEYSQVRDGAKYRAEFTLGIGGDVYRAEEWQETLHEAIDMASAELAKELRRKKRKHHHLVRRGGAIIKDTIRGFRDQL